MSKNYATEFKVIRMSLYKVGEEAKPYVNLAGDMCKQFQYFEDIMWPSYAATMVIQDNTENIISTMPIQGFERVVVEVDDLTETSGSNKGRYTYDFRIWNISNRVGNERKQTYTLGLISYEGLRNEGTVINRQLTGNVSEIVTELLTKDMGIPSTSINVERSVTSMKILPTKKTPYTLIKSFLKKSISEKIAIATDDSKEETTEVVSDVVDSESQKGSGTAGFLFFQTNRGFVFKSIDTLISDANPIQGDKFFWQPAKLSDPSLNRIQEIVFGQEFDMIKKLREGHFSSVVCSFNINTLTYKEQKYSLKDTWNDMAHLGSQTKLPKGQRELSEYPTRVMSTILDNEVFNQDPKIASVDDGGDGSHRYQDLQLHYLSQGLARAGLLFNQQLTISITGHLELCAGDKIEIKIPDQSAEVAKETAYDTEHSGTYLIKQVNHQFNMGDSRTVYTVLDLIRDSQGIQEQESNVK